MHNGLRYILARLLATAAAAAPPVQYINSRTVTLDLTPANAAPISEVEVWYGRDGTEDWTPIAAERPGSSTVRLTLPDDGRFPLFVLLRNAGGASSSPPERGSPPTAVVVVDTLAPLVQLRGCTAPPGSAAGPLRLDASVVDSHLTDDAIHVFYRAVGDDAGDVEWLDGGTARRVESALEWTPPVATATCDVRIVAVDQAGNRGVSDVLPVDLAPRAAESTAGTPAGHLPIFWKIHYGVGVTTAPGGTSYFSDEPDNSRAQPPALKLPVANPSELHRLRELATRFTKSGEYSLAAARYNDAVALDPQDPNLLVDFGSVLYRLGRYDEADTQFNAALGPAPEHLGALDGLALVAATKRRYPQAREYLQRLQKIEPASSTVWLRTGDIEHRLGNGSQALAAWEQALRLADNADLRTRAQRRLDVFRHETNALPATQPSPSDHDETTGRAFDHRRTRR